MGMTEIKQYWIDGCPHIEDVEEAFKIVKEQNVIVQLRWYVKYSGSYSANVSSEDIEKGVQEFFNKYIPQVYPV